VTDSAAHRAHAQFQRRYVDRTPASRDHYELARRRLPGGVPGSASYRSPYPLYLKEAIGPRITDLDGNSYLDLLIGGGPHILGHSNPVVADAVERQMRRGTSTIVPGEISLQLAELIHEHMPHLEQIRYVTTGAEAMHMSIRVARGFTGRDRIGKFEGNFHGGYDNELVSGRTVAGDQALPVPTSDGAGIPASVLADTLVLPYNDTAATVALIEAHADKLAAVVIEPIACTWMGGVPAELDFLRAVRDVTTKHGIILIFDEIVTGFRVSLGGAAQLTGVTPDLTALAKIIGGGYPLGAFGGRADIMHATLDPVSPGDDASRSVFQSGTFQSNLISMTAGFTALTELARDGVLDRINAFGDRMRTEIVKHAVGLGLPMHGLGYGSIVGFHFADAAPTSMRDVLASQREFVAAFCLGLVVHDVFITPYHLGLTNGSQTDADIDTIIDTAKNVLDQIAAA
jgi:glutamate-1-semialdehyde 2,1-aminomutase